MAMNDKLPMDMTTLDADIFIPILEGNPNGASEKDQVIRKIKNIIDEWGAFCIGDVQSESSPIINNISKDRYILAEKFGLDSATGVEYIDGNEIDEYDYDYEDLDLDTLNDILEIAEEFDVQCYKDEQRQNDH